MRRRLGREFKIEAAGLIKNRGYGSSYGTVYCIWDSVLSKSGSSRFAILISFKTDNLHEIFGGPKPAKQKTAPTL